MKINNEWDLIEKISAINKKNSSTSLIKGIGDDAAITRIDKNRYSLFTTDISIESIHFIIEKTTPENIGYKAMAGNISDISAMGGEAKFALISLGIPEYIDENFILSLYKGMNSVNEEIQIIGGDISASKELIINISLYGEMTGKPVERGNARTGDTIYITGNLGSSKAGLEILSNNEEETGYDGLINKHLKPQSIFPIIEFIMKEYCPNSMIDISDGLLSDLRHICEASKKGFILNDNKIPVSEELISYCKEKNKKISDYTYNSGEEYELLFTSNIKENIIVEKSIAITPIGTITESEYFISHGEKKEEIHITGYNHFLKE
jgi:thiamine-monophosphate kinase